MSDWRKYWATRNVERTEVFTAVCPMCDWRGTPHLTTIPAGEFKRADDQARDAATVELIEHLAAVHYPDGVPEMRCWCGHASTYDEHVRHSEAVHS